MNRCIMGCAVYFSSIALSALLINDSVYAQDSQAKVVATKLANSSSTHTRSTSPISNKSFQLNEEGVALIFEGKRAEGKKKIQEAIALDHNNATALYNMAGLLLSEGETERAIEKMKQAVSLEPNDSAFLNRLAEAYFAANNIDMSIATYERLAENDASYDLTLLRLGSLYAMKEDWEKAETTFKRAIRANLADRQILHALGSILVAKGDYTQALTYLNEAQKEKQTVETAEAIAVAYESQAAWNKAIDHYKLVLKLAPEREDIKEKLIKIEKQRKLVP